MALRTLDAMGCCEVELGISAAVGLCAKSHFRGFGVGMPDWLAWMLTKISSAANNSQDFQHTQSNVRHIPWAIIYPTPGRNPAVWHVGRDTGSGIADDRAPPVAQPQDNLS